MPNLVQLSVADGGDLYSIYFCYQFPSKRFYMLTISRFKVHA